MFWFLAIFVAIYGLLNAYPFWRICAAFPQLGKGRLVLAGFMLVMIAAPFLVHTLERWRWVRLANVTAAVGYSWMAIAFWLFVLFALADAWNLAVRGVGLITPAVRSAILPGPEKVAACGAIVVFAFCWGLFEAADIRIRSVTIPVARLPEGRRTFTIAQITDVHVGLHTGRRRLAKAVALIERARPDVLVSTGDLVDSSFQRTNHLVGLLADLHPPFGKYAVLGNHEFYAGLDHSLPFHEAAGFKLLRGQWVQIAPGLRIAGVDDPAGQRRTGAESFLDENLALPPADAGAFTVFLKHQPRIEESSLGRFDLQLSGHTHGGQIFPWHFITGLSYRFAQGLHLLPGGRCIYVSRGTGTWGPPIRVLAPPEVTLITLDAAAPAPRVKGFLPKAGDSATIP